MTILPTNRQSKNEDNQSSQPDEAPEEISSSLEDPPPSESLTPSRKRTYNADLFFINTKRLREESSQEEEDEERSNSGDEERCNSEDEYDIKKKLTEDEWRNRDIIFAKSLEKRGFVIKPMIEDGACLFRAIADQVYGDQNKHTVVRKHCMDYILKNRDFFADYITEDFNKYVNRKRHDFVHGNHLEIQALSEMYHRSIEVYSYQLKPINIFHQNSSYEPIRLSYQRASHYNSIVNPFKNTIGVGLGLPENNEDLLIEKAMLEDKLKATDWEATNEVIEEQVARESYLQWCKDNEKRRKRNSSEGCSSTVTSNDCKDATSSKSSPRTSSTLLNKKLSPKNHPPDLENANTISEDSQNFYETNSIFNLPPEVFGLQDWENADILARVLAASQQEYLDNLKEKNYKDKNPEP